MRPRRFSEAEVVVLGRARVIGAAEPDLRVARRDDHDLLDRMRPGEEEARVPHPVELAETEHHGAALRRYLTDVAHRPEHGENEHAEEDEAKDDLQGLRPGAFGWEARSMCGRSRRSCGGAGLSDQPCVCGPSIRTRKGAASVAGRSRIGIRDAVERVERAQERIKLRIGIEGLAVDARGFLPGLGFDTDRLRARIGEEDARVALGVGGDLGGLALAFRHLRGSRRHPFRRHARHGGVERTGRKSAARCRAAGR